ncbi:TetR/AcrR family transcriptional regulator [Glycomyces tarimensis]
METGTGVREASRRVVQSQIAEAAEALFIAKGFEETTVDEIAAAVGMSQRSFFRYFASKDDIVLDHLVRLGDDLDSALESRPADEPEWDSLHRAFDLVVEQYADRAQREHGAATQRIVDDSPRLLAAYLQRLDRVQQRLTERLNARALDRERPSDPVVMRAMVGAAFACLHATLCHVATEGDPERFGHHLDKAMTALRPGSV